MSPVRADRARNGRVRCAQWARGAPARSRDPAPRVVSVLAALAFVAGAVVAVEVGGVRAALVVALAGALLRSWVALSARYTRA